VKWPGSVLVWHNKSGCLVVCSLNRPEFKLPPTSAQQMLPAGLGGFISFVSGGYLAPQLRRRGERKAASCFKRGKKQSLLAMTAITPQTLLPSFLSINKKYNQNNQYNFITPFLFNPIGSLYP